MVDAVLIGFGVIAIAIGAVLYSVQFGRGCGPMPARNGRERPAPLSPRSLKNRGHGWRYRAALQYNYRVGGKNYESSRIFWGGNEGGQKHMSSVVETYPAGGSVRVFYDPKNPAEAVLDPIQNTGSRQLVLYALAMVTLGLFTVTGGIYSLFH